MKKVDQGKQKLLNYIDRFIDSDYFQNGITELRKEFRIPSNGFKLSIKSENKLIINRKINAFFHIPKILKNRKKNILKDINIALKNLNKKFPINDPQIIFVFKIYLFYNKKLYEVLNETIDETNLCRIENIKEELEEYNFLAPPKEVVKIFKRKFKDYPIILKLHPSISQRDLLNYIKNHWAIISFYLERHKDGDSMLGRIRTRNNKIKERDQFIYKYRNLPYGQIISLVSQNFSKDVSLILDEGNIGKIISLEKERRKQV